MCLSETLLEFDLEWPWTEIQRVKFPTFAVSPPDGRFGQNLSMLAHYHKPSLTSSVNFVSIGRKTASQVKTTFFILLLEPSPFRHLLANFIQIKLCCAAWQTQLFLQISSKSVEKLSRNDIKCLQRNNPKKRAKTAIYFWHSFYS
jgi:hypothetical protein